MTRRIRVRPGHLEAGENELEPEAAHYARDVLRLRVGDPVELFDGEGAFGQGSLLGSSRDRVVVQIPAIGRAPPPRGPAVTLIQAVGKGEKVEQVVRQASELGVQRIVVVATQRTVAERVERSDRARTRVHPADSGPRSTHKLDRWRGIAEDATRLSGRYFVPQIVGVLPLEAWLDEPRAGLALALDGTAEAGLKACLAPLVGAPPPTIEVAIGPEGGFSPEERDLLRTKGFCLTTLGPHTLRTETAGPAVLAILAHAFA